MDFLIRLVQVHETFRLPEIQALADLHHIPLEILSYSPDSPFLLVRLPSVDHASRLIARSIISKSIYHLWASGSSHQELHQALQPACSTLCAPYTDASFRFTLDTYRGPTPPHTPTSQRNLINTFSYLPLHGPIRMTSPDEEYCVFEEYSPTNPPILTRAFFARKIADGSRSLITRYDLKKRRYISTTSMDAELALITANLALAAPEKLFYDPFVGTGGFPVAVAHFGAKAWGSDIDGRCIRGSVTDKGVEKNVMGNFQQYGLDDGWMDGLVADLTHSPLRGFERRGRGWWLDGIVCDPPYGVREGLKVLGSRDPNSSREEVFVDGVPAYQMPGHIPPKRPYSFVRMLSDLLSFAADMLVDDGRLAFWMPTASEEDSIPLAERELGIPTHPRLEVVSVCIQPFNKWSRRLLTYKRIPDACLPDDIQDLEAQRADAIIATTGGDGTGTADELNPFRKKYFDGFRPPPNAEVSGPSNLSSDQDVAEKT